MLRCHPTGSRPEIQEHQVSDRTVSFVEHKDDNHFIINLHALHNATLLRRVLPPALVKPSLVHPNQQEHHYDVAASLRVQREAKRVARNNKGKATRAANKLKQAQSSGLRVVNTSIPADEQDVVPSDSDSQLLSGDDADPPDIPLVSRKRARVHS